MYLHIFIMKKADSSYSLNI